MSRLLAVMLMLSLLGVGFAQTTLPPYALNAADFGAKGDGVTDDTAAIQAAMDTAQAQKGGIVWLPRGNYRINTHLTVPDDVTLEGVWTIPTAWTQMEGTTLLAYEGKGSEDGPAFITLCRNGTIKGLTVFYPEQDKENIQPYPFCVAGNGADNPSIVDCLLVNPYKGVDFMTRNSGRHYIRNLYGQPLRIGIQVDKCYDVGRIENVHFWPFWTWGMDTHVGNFMRENGEAFIFARTDWEYVFNTFIFGYKTGYKFINSEAGGCNGNFLGIGADATNVAVQVDGIQEIGILITNGEFVSFLQPNPCQVVVNEKSTGVVQFNNCAFWGPTDNIARIKGTGHISFNQCHFLHWDIPGKGFYGIDCESGNLTVGGSRFSSRAPAIHLGEDVRTASIYGSMFSGRTQVVNESTGDVQIGLNTSALQPIKVEEGAIAVDDADGAPAFTTTGQWTVYDSNDQLAGRAMWTAKDSDATATWSTKLPQDGKYAVYAFIGADPNRDHAKDAVYTVTWSTGRTSTVTVDQTAEAGKWVKLGAWRFRKDHPATVSVVSSTSGNVIIDAVKFVPEK